MSIAGKRILITGASSGIGAALARACAREGAVVALAARRADRLAEVLADCRAGSVARVCDLSDPEAGVRLLAELWRTWGPIDVLVNNAGMPMRRRVTRLATADLDRVMTVNFTSPARMAMAALPLMLDRGAGAIVNVSSVAGRFGVTGEAAYAASKFALCGWTESMALELHRTPVTVHLVLPGPIDTEIWDLPDNDPPYYTGPKIDPDEVAAAVLGALASGRIETYVPDYRELVARKTADVDGFIAERA